MRRNIFLPALFFCLGIFYGQNCNNNTIKFGSVLMVIMLCCISFVVQRRHFDLNYKKLIIIIMCFIIGFANIVLQSCSDAELCDNCLGKSSQVVITVDRITCANKDKIVFDGHGRIVGLNKVSKQTFRVTAYRNKVGKNDDTKLLKSLIIVSGTIDKAKHNSNPHCFDYNTYLFSIGINYTMAATHIEVKREYEHNISTIVYKEKKQFIEKLYDKYDKNVVDMASGILFGDKEQLDDDIYEQFKNNGTAHILAVSGLHVGLIFAVIRRLFKKRNKILYYSILSGTLISYGIITQWSISVVRALIMIFFSILAEILYRKYDMLSCLIATATIILIFKPCQLFNPGFQMSFLAVLGIAVGYATIRRVVGNTLGIVISAQLLLVPYLAYNYNYVSISSLILNYPTGLLVSVIVPLGMFSFVLFSVIGYEFNLLNDVLTNLINVMLKLNSITGTCGIGTFNVVSPNPALVIITILLLIFLFSECFKILLLRKKYVPVIVHIGLILVIGIWTLPTFQSSIDGSDIVFVDVGQGDCVHIRSLGKNYLFDTGGKMDYDLGNKTLKPYLLKNGASNLEGVFITHNHADHYLGGCQLSQRYKIREAFFSLNYNEIRNRLQSQLKCKRMSFLTSSNTVKLNKDLSVKVLWPRPGNNQLDEDNENLNCLVMKILYKEISILITGDIDENCEKEIVKEYENSNILNCNILKISHHGSKYSTSDELLKAVNPSLAIIQVGKNNYGHPSNIVIDKCKKLGIMVLRTDEDGAIGIFTTKDNGLCINKELNNNGI